MWFVVKVMKFREGIARMTLGNSVVNSHGVAKAQVLGKIDKRVHITAVILRGL
jgi:hypothetical protein